MFWSNLLLFLQKVTPCPPIGLGTNKLFWIYANILQFIFKKSCHLVMEYGRFSFFFIVSGWAFLLRKVTHIFCTCYRFCIYWCPWRITLVCISFVSLPNILSWAAYLIRVITINVWLLAQSYWSYVFSRDFFSVPNYVYFHQKIILFTHIFQEIFALELYLVASVFYLPNSTVLHFSNRRAFIFFSLSLYIHPSIPLPS